MNKHKTFIWVTFKKEGIHKYPAALEDPALATGDEYDVSFLGYPHRHIFHFKVEIEVFHNDRDIEFIQFKRPKWDYYLVLYFRTIFPKNILFKFAHNLLYLLLFPKYTKDRDGSQMSCRFFYVFLYSLNNVF